MLAADTVVALGDRPLGKPADADDARQMLRLLGGTTHQVITGVCVAPPRHEVSSAAAASRPPSTCGRSTEAEIDAYVASGDWQGKAGGYGIQDDDPFVTRISGCHTNIVGLPMTDTARLLAEAGVHPKQQ